MVALGYEFLWSEDGSSKAPLAPELAERVVSSPAEVPSEGVLEGTGSTEVIGETSDDGPAAEADPDDRPAWLVPDEDGHYTAFPPIYADPVPLDEEAQKTFTRHGVVTSVAAIVRLRADLDGPMLGMLHGGTRVRVDQERSFGGNCPEGWNRIHPKGWVCRLVGMRVGDEPPAMTVSVPTPDLNAPLPYEYWRVNDEMTPFFHRLPSFTEQDRADQAGSAWYAEHQRDPMPLDASQRPEDVPSVVKQYMNAGYYVTKSGEEIRSERHFIRTLRGAYARKYQLSRKDAPSFRGQVLDGESALPMYFIRRELAFMRRSEDNPDLLVKSEEVPDRLSIHPFVQRIEMGPKAYYEDEEGRLLRAYSVSKAYKLKRPPGVGANEHWIHIDLSEQTLVAYEGDVPVFATLVSTGREPGMTPVGIHRVQTKYVATSMRDQPPEDEAYSIDDVPWTQYFAGSVALHGAFWHASFGLVRSHGCVNLSPSDARWLFGFTAPEVPHDWYAIAAQGREGSAVVVTD